MLSEMGNKVVKRSSGRCNSEKGELVRRGRGHRGVPHLFIVRPLEDNTCMEASSTSRDKKRKENKKMKEEDSRFK